MGIRDTVNKYKALLQDDRYDDVFKKCSPNERVELVTFLYNAGVNILAHMSSIPNGLFSYCDDIKTITIPDHITSVGNAAFEQSGVEAVYMSDSVTELGKNVFSDCSNLQTVRLSRSLEEIPENTFRNCRSLHKIFIPDSVTFIGKDAFYGCDDILIGATYRKNPKDKLQFMSSDVDFYKTHMKFKRA